MDNLVPFLLVLWLALVVDARASHRNARARRSFVPHARQVTRSRAQALPMSRIEWIVALNRADDYEGGWTQYLTQEINR